MLQVLRSRYKVWRKVKASGGKSFSLLRFLLIRVERRLNGRNVIHSSESGESRDIESHGSSQNSLVPEEYGVLLLYLTRAVEHIDAIPANERDLFLSDMMELASDMSISQKLGTMSRMFRTYPFLNLADIPSAGAKEASWATIEDLHGSLEEMKRWDRERERKQWVNIRLRMSGN